MVDIGTIFLEVLKRKRVKVRKVGGVIFFLYKPELGHMILSSDLDLKVKMGDMDLEPSIPENGRFKSKKNQFILPFLGKSYIVNDEVTFMVKDIPKEGLPELSEIQKHYGSNARLAKSICIEYFVNQTYLKLLGRSELHQVDDVILQ